MSKILYTPEEMRGKFIVCSRVPLLQNSFLGCVTYSSGERSGLPYLYDSIKQAMADKYFDEYFDEVVPASLYFERKEPTEKQVIKPNKSEL